MDEPQSIAGLRAKRDEILAEIARLRADLAEIDAALGAKKKALQRGSVGRLLFDALREAQGALSTVQLGEYVAVHSGLDTADKDAMLHLVSNVGKAMGHYRKNGHVISERRGHMTWWRLPE